MTAWLLTWLWQGAALTAAVAVLQKWSGTRPLFHVSAATRHLIWWTTLLAVIGLGFASSPYWGLTPVLVFVRGADPIGTEFAATPVLHIPGAPPLALSIVLGIWIALALMNLLRLLPGLHAVYALRDRCRPFPADLESQLPLWSEAKTHGRGAELAVCDAVPGATVLGFQRPCIALPSTLLRSMDAGEIDQIVLHEYAHVQRFDDWSRLAQVLLQSALWVHPAVAFIGRSLNREREMACDEWVVARTGLPKAYARCLAHAAEVRQRIRIDPGLLPALFRTEHDLVRRVDHLLTFKGRARRKVSLPAAAIACCAIAAASVQLNAVPLVGELVEGALPQVARPVARIAAALELPLSGAVIAAPAELPAAPRTGTAHELDQPNEGGERREIDEPYETHGADELTALHTLNEPREPNPVAVPLSVRSFPGAYRMEDAASSASDRTGWAAVASPGVAVADAARKTSVGLAGAFSRAGVALARRF
jgi:beta-lactamase regulating signal transducer with metallopeptidase domain